MKLKYYLDKKQNKVYTLKEKDKEGNETKPAHYKFLKYNKPILKEY